jgi:hypothetical protein
MKNDY